MKMSNTVIAVLAAAIFASSGASGYQNISTRANIGVGENIMIAGFILDHEQTVVIRGLGPTLAEFGITNPLFNPMIALFIPDPRGGSQMIAINHDWQEFPDTNAVGLAFMAAHNLNPKFDQESAIIMRLPPGQYTVMMCGEADVTGVGLAEVYLFEDGE